MPTAFDRLSIEGWAMLLLSSIQHRFVVPDEFRGRWAALDRFGCDPRPEIDSLRAKLAQPRPSLRMPRVSRPAFELGRVHLSHRLGNPVAWDDVAPALALIELTVTHASMPAHGSK